LQSLYPLLRHQFIVIIKSYKSMKWWALIRYPVQHFAQGEISMSVKYKGSFNKLKKYVRLTGIIGSWKTDGTGKHVFRSDAGGVLNWWPSSGTVNFQGAPDGRCILEILLKDQLSPENGLSVQSRIAIENDSTDTFDDDDDDDDADWSQDNFEDSLQDSLRDNSLKGNDASDELLGQVNKLLSEHGLFVMMRDDLLCVVPNFQIEI
jgi:hypothetical protein